MPLGCRHALDYERQKITGRAPSENGLSAAGKKTDRQQEKMGAGDEKAEKTAGKQKEKLHAFLEMRPQPF
ncbi:hypothetical protein [Pseudoflavonifractor phocaeensis]|uniref:hypothetical protein n=1 Tax=Pseudoflavonifractor phocaeensis TaxID=1870988 RepID=UPI00195635C6|nr:hypothetical protein [Pseudoflavonifractor phocaeensis]MBM6869168.1 hypothetical protein [Pseudoflavonifractor phocaeensis]